MEHQKQFEFLKGKFGARQLGHAYLFSGQDTDNLKSLAKELVKLVNKDIVGAQEMIEKVYPVKSASQGEAVFREAEQFNRGAYPDLCIVKSQNSRSSLKDGEDKQEIDIALIREVQNFLSYKSYYGGYKTVIIENAERMNTDAADCFLKNLEEPRGDTLILLLSSKPEILPATIFSRCQVLKFSGSPNIMELPQNLKNILEADLAEKFKYAKTVNLEGGNFENILEMLQNHWRKDIGKYRNVLKLALDLERQAQVSNINKKLALEILLMEVHPVK